MIAVFCKDQRIYNELDLTPKNEFRRIRTLEDVRGIEFTGIIRMYGWFDDWHMREAYDYLNCIHPELFKK